MWLNAMANHTELPFTPLYLVSASKSAPQRQSIGGICHSLYTWTAIVCHPDILPCVLCLFLFLCFNQASLYQQCITEFCLVNDVHGTSLCLCQASSLCSLNYLFGLECVALRHCFWRMLVTEHMSHHNKPCIQGDAALHTANPIVMHTCNCCGTEVGTDSETYSYSYVPGAGDDEESWARGLTPALFWQHHQVSQA